MKFKSAILTEASGKIGGMIASHGRGGSYFRAAAAVTNPNTLLQQAVRSIFGSLVTAWTTTLSQSERDAWDAFADQVPRTNSLGEEYFATGQQSYIGNNTPRIQAGLARVDTAPTIFNGGSPVTAVPTFADTPAINLDISPAADDDGDALVFVGPPINASKKFYKGPWRFAGTAAVASAATTAAVTPAEVSGTYAENEVRSVRAVMTYDDGRLSQPYVALATVTAGG